MPRQTSQAALSDNLANYIKQDLLQKFITLNIEGNHYVELYVSYLQAKGKTNVVIE